MKLEARAQNQSLALSYGPEEERAALERAMIQSALNPQANLDANERVDMVHKLTVITKPQLLVWSRALMHGAEGVDFNTHPRGEFPSDPIKVWTKKERQAVPKQFAPFCCTPSSRWVYPQKFNPPTLSADAPSPLTLKARQVSGIVSPQGGTLLPKAIPTRDADSFSGDSGMEDKYPSNTGALDDAELSDYEALFAAGELPNILATKPAGSAPKTPATNPNPSAKHPKSAGIITKTTAVASTSTSNKSKTSKTPGNTSKGQPSSKKNPLCSDSNVNNQHSPLAGPQRPESKKSSAHHPVGDDLLYSFASSIGRVDSPKVPMDTTSTFQPLNEKGLALSLREFLGLIGFDAGNRVIWALFDLNHIHHWGFFRRATVNQLRRRGFPFPIAGQLINGARAVEHQFVQAGSPLAKTLANIGASSPAPEAVRVPCSPGY
ncbi:hypothetical protein PCANC_14065 [Puccinia coronata f. sp. avenae]|uniref:Uncharacterized protein n=1 Tax=Puccinia coronata f. sp. avenae TaxID=200324 RepID=A0A2N5SVV3_9BASI|nr:hypothetical protein PCANC_14065 [Puccinia coronata f. sp. avenae]